MCVTAQKGIREKCRRGGSCREKKGEKRRIKDRKPGRREKGLINVIQTPFIITPSTHSLYPHSDHSFVCFFNTGPSHVFKESVTHFEKLKYGEFASLFFVQTKTAQLANTEIFLHTLLQSHDCNTRYDKSLQNVDPQVLYQFNLTFYL